MKYPFVQQHDEKDCGAACLSMICEYYGKKLQLAKLRELIKVDNQGANIYGIVTGAEALGLHADALEGDRGELLDGIKTGEVKLPFIARIINEYGYEHFIVVYKISDKKVKVGDPGKSSTSYMKTDSFFSQWQGHIITFEPDKSFAPCNERKGTYSKYARFITSQKKMLTFIFIVSLIISGINIFSSVVFQYVLNNTELAMNQAMSQNQSTGYHGAGQNNTLQPTDQTTAPVNDYSKDDGTGTVKYGKVLTIIDKASVKLDIVFRNIKTVCITVILLYILSCIIQVMRGFMLAQTAKRVNIPLSLGYYDHLMKLPYNFFGTRKTGEFMSRFADTEKIREVISSTALTIMLDSIMAIACGILLFYINSKLFLITLTVLVIYFIIVVLFKKSIAHVNYEYMESDAQVTAYLKESIDGIETIKAYQCEERANHKVAALFDKFTGLFVKGSVIYILQDALVGTVASIGTVILLWKGAELCATNVISIADLLIYYYLINYFINPVKNLIDLQPQLQIAAVAANRLNDVVEAEPEGSDSGKAVLDTIGDVVIKDLDFRYGNRELVLNGIDMHIRQGTKTAIVGESGCGKTTLVKLLLDFYSPEKGTISYNGRSIDEYTVASVRRKIAYVSQNIFLFADSIMDNLTLGNEEIPKEKVEEVCKLCKIHDYIMSLPMGYDTMVEESGMNLSGGQKQRIAIARAILRDPDLLIFDEATSHLDTLTENGIKEAIDLLCTGKTCIFIAHRLKTIRSCDQIYVMDNGHVTESGTHDELVAASGQYASLFSES